MSLPNPPKGMIMTGKEIYDSMPKSLRLMIGFSGAAFAVSFGLAIVFVVYTIGCQVVGL